MNFQENIKKNFLSDTKDFQMTIDLDQGVHRSLLFNNPECNNCWFRLITFPGGLTITGDMNTYTFSRIHDMINFFHNDINKINPNYWAEKLQAPSKYQEWDLQKADELILDHFENHVEALEYWELYKDEGQHGWYEFLYRYSDYNDFWEISTSANQYTYHYIWCLYAICWGIKTYEESKK